MFWNVRMLFCMILLPFFILSDEGQQSPLGEILFQKLQEVSRDPQRIGESIQFLRTDPQILRFKTLSEKEQLQYLMRIACVPQLLRRIYPRLPNQKEYVALILMAERIRFSLLHGPAILEKNKKLISMMESGTQVSSFITGALSDHYDTSPNKLSPSPDTIRLATDTVKEYITADIDEKSAKIVALCSSSDQKQAANAVDVLKRIV